MRYLIIFMFTFFCYTGKAAAYVGPGLGLGVIGAIFGVFATVILAIIGLFWYPLKRLYRSIRSRLTHNGSDDDI
jgi:MFS-type transporter involved in bile tolerance (Atg22 family)